jgi:hypothetical protein
MIAIEVREVYARVNGWEAANEEPEQVCRAMAHWCDMNEMRIADIVQETFPYVSPAFMAAFDVMRLAYSDEFAEYDIGKLG